MLPNYIANSVVNHHYDVEIIERAMDGMVYVSIQQLTPTRI